MQFYANMTLTCFFFQELTSDSWRGGGIDKGADWTWEVPPPLVIATQKYGLNTVPTPTVA